MYKNIFIVNMFDIDLILKTKHKSLFREIHRLGLK
jgi:hypothetical protein